MTIRRSLATFLIALLAASCHPARTSAPAIDVRDAWARATAPGQSTGALYLTIISSSSQGDRLVAVSTPRASMAMLHQSTEKGGVTAMRALADLPVPGGSSVTLAPLGAHIMLSGLSAPLKTGERIPVTLRFARSGERQIDAAVLGPGASGPSK